MARRLQTETILLLIAGLLCLASGIHASSYTDPLMIPDTIRIASEPDYPPYSTVDKNGKADGFAVELFLAAAREVNMEVTVSVGVWNKIMEDLTLGNIDALPLVGRTPEREDLYDFTLPYLSLHGAVFARKGTRDIRSPEDLKGKEIIVMKGDNAEEFVRRMNYSDHIWTTNTFQEAFEMLANGEHDVVVTQRITGIKLLKESGIKSVAPLDFTLPQFRQDFCFAVQKGNAELLAKLNEGLSVVLANGTFDELRLKWFGPAENAWVDDYRRSDRLALFLILLSVILVVTWIVFLRREVRRRTGSLYEEIAHHQSTLEKLRTEQEALQEKEAQIRLLLDSTAEGIYAIDVNGICTLVNKSALNMLGMKSQQDAIGKNMHLLVHNKRPDGTSLNPQDCRIFHVFVDGQGRHGDDEYFWRIDGTGFPVEYFSYPLWWNNQISGVVVTFWDIAERKETERKIRKLQEDLESTIAERTAALNDKVHKLDRSQKAMLFMVEDMNRIAAELREERVKLELSNKELEAFTYSVSHDLRAPLRAINGFSKFLMEDYSAKIDNEGKRFIETIRHNAAKMDRLITDLLNLSRITRAELKLSEVDLSSQAVAAFSELASDKEKKEFHIQVGQIHEVSADPGLMKQVWQNLVGNALKYSSKSAIKRIEVGFREENDEIVCFVKDHGAGFNPRYVHKLFGVFQRLHRDDEFEGTGVGLALVKRIINRHGGRVWAEGEAGKGACIYFTLPKNNVKNHIT